jgi:Rrf2 family protein
MVSIVDGHQTLRTFLKREESYAIHALLYLNEYPGAPASQIAADLKLPAAFTAKVLRRLAEAGFVDSRSGRTGGVRLAKDLADLTLLDVIEAMSGSFIIDTCQTERQCATTKRKGYCQLNTTWLALSLQFRDALSSVRLHTLADDPAEIPATKEPHPA